MDPNEAEHRIHVGQRAVDLALRRMKERAARTPDERAELEARVRNGELKIDEVEEATSFEPPKDAPPSYRDRV